MASASPVPGSAAGEKIEARIAQGPPSGAGRIRAVGARCRSALRRSACRRSLQALPMRRRMSAARAMDRVRDRRPAPISCAMSASLGSVRTSAAKAGSSRASRSRKERERRGESARSRPATGFAASSERDQQAHRDGLRRLPAVERVACRAAAATSSSSFGRSSDDLHRGREAAEQRRHRRRRHVREGDAVGRLVEHEDAVARRRGRRSQRRGAPSCDDEAERDRDRHRLLVRLARRRRRRSARSRGGRSARPRRNGPSPSTRGVPACSYQRAKCDRSRPVTSAKQARKSSTVAAVPSQRSK